MDPIVTPEIGDSFYRNSIASLEKSISKYPDEEKYVKLQLAYYERLGWPEEAGKAISRASVLLGTDPVYLSQSITYFTVNNKQAELYNFIQKYVEEGEITRSMERYRIAALVSMYAADARSALSAFAAGPLEVGDFQFLSNNYLLLSDSILSVYYFSKGLKQTEFTAVDLERMLPIMLDMHLYEKVIELLEGEIYEENHNPNSSLLLAKAYRGYGDLQKSKDILKRNLDVENLFLLADWYKEESSWDSAHYCMDKALSIDSLNQKAMLVKGDIDQHRAFFTRSISFYRQVIELDSTNEYAADQIEIVNRKIAYLQRIRKTKIPILELESKKIKDN
jgi:hypothetical protein